MRILVLFLVLLAPAEFAQESYDTLLQHWDYDHRAPLDTKQVALQKRDGVVLFDLRLSLFQSFGANIFNDLRISSVRKK